MLRMAGTDLVREPEDSVDLAARAREIATARDLRHYLASLLIGSGLDVKVVQHRLRHGSAKTTLDTYGHLWPDSDESARAAVGAVLAARAEDGLRTNDTPAG